MPYIQGEDRNQVTMFPPTLDDYISNDNDVRVIDAFVKGLDMEAMGFIRHTASKDGRPGYDPRDMLRLYIYGYLNKIRSSRKLQTECTRNIELMWLLCKLIPDFRCISDFRKDNAKGIKLVFCEFTKLCDRLQLLGKKSIVIDGSKFKAVNARSKHITKAQAEDRFFEIEKKISEYMNMLDKNDKEETPLEEKSIEEIRDELEALKAKKEKYESYLDEMNSTGETQKSFTDPEAKLMKGNGKFDVSYNTQTAVDSKNHIIADFIVTDHCNDMGLLEEVAKAAKEVMDVDNIDLTADKGYRDSKDIKNCILNGDIPNVNLLDDHEDYTFELKYEENDITEEEKRSKTRSDIEKCLSSGVIPEVLKSKVTIELVDDDIETYEYDADEKIFERNLEDNTVTCPNGEILRKKCKHRGKVRYANKSACCYVKIDVLQ